MYSIITIDSRGTDTFISESLEDSLIKCLYYLSSVILFDNKESITRCLDSLKESQVLELKRNDYKFKIDSETIECMIFENESFFSCDDSIDSVISELNENTFEFINNKISTLKSEIENLESKLNYL